MSEIVVLNSDERPSRSKVRFGLTINQVLLFLLILGAGPVLLLLTVQVALINTLLIFVFITLVGFWLCRATAIRLGDMKLRILGTLWLIKVGLTLFLLYSGWIPDLSQGLSASGAYDPQRYYYDAYTLIEDGWNPVVGSNYQGIIFYYGAIFYLFGHNPVIPALINVFVTLLGTLFLIRASYEFRGLRGSRNWTIAYVLLIPEILWYDVMTSRETLAAVLILVPSLSMGRYLVGTSKVTLLRTLLVSGVCIIFLLAVRTTMVLPVLISITFIGLLLHSRRQFGITAKVLLVAFLTGLVLLGPLVQYLIGGVNVDYVASLQSVQSSTGVIASGHEWSENSIGLLLAPNSIIESILFLLPRTLLYLIAPLPNIGVSITDLLAGSWGAWQNLLTVATSCIIIFALPYALSGFSFAIRQRKQYPAPLILHITFWVTLLSIAGGNIIIHERYRIMMTLLLFTSAWLGYTSCTRKQINRYAVAWYALLVCVTIFYMIYKIL